MLTALPQSVTLNYNEIAYALEKSLIKLDAALMKVLETMPPELYADIVKNGIYLAGGGALIKGLDRRLTEKTGLPFHIAEDPLRAIARGTGIALKNIDRFSFLMTSGTVPVCGRRLRPLPETGIFVRRSSRR